MKKLLISLCFVPAFLSAQSAVDSIYIFDIGDEFHYEIIDSNTLIKKFEKRIVIGKTQFGGVYQYRFQFYGRIKHPTIAAPHSYDFIRTTSYPGLAMIATDSVAPCLDSNHVHYNSTFSNPALGIHYCTFTDTIVTSNSYGPTYKRSYFSSNTYSIDDYFSTGLGRSLRIEKYTNSTSSYNITEKLVFYRKVLLDTTWGIPWTFTLLGITENQSLNFSLYPNPANQFISVNFKDNSGSFNYQLMNTLGQVILSGENEQATIDVSSTTSGIYLLKITKEDKVGIRKVIISR